MERLDYKLVGREATAWQKKYFFREVGRPGNPDSAFILLLASQRRRDEGAADAPGSDVFARLVDHYGKAHLTENPREVVRGLVDIASAAAARAEGSKVELAAGFVHIKGRRAAAGSVGRLRAGLADRESIVATFPLPDRAGKKGGAGQVSLDLGQTIEGDLTERPAFFIAPSSAVAVGDESLRRFLWDMMPAGRGIESRPPSDWKHLPCLVGSAAPAEAGAAQRPGAPALTRALSTVRGRARPTARAATIARTPGRRAAEPVPEPRGSGRRSAAWRTALWVCVIAAIAFSVIKFGLRDRGGTSPTTPESLQQAATAAAGEVGDRAGVEAGDVSGGAVEERVEAASGVPEGGDAVAGPSSAPALERLWRRGVGGVLTSSAVDLGDAVAFGSRAGVVFCLTKADGSTRWSFKGPDGFGSSPAYYGGRIFIGCYNGGVYCLDARDGSRIWTYKTGARVVSSPAMTPDGDVLVGSYDGYLYCLSPDGGLKWRFNAGARVWSSPLASEGRALFADVSGHVYCLDRETGRAVWSKTAGGAIHGSPAAGDGFVCFGSGDGAVASFSLADGALRWRYKGDSEVSSSIALGEGSVFAGYEDGSFVRLSDASGEPVWRTKLPGAVRSRPMIGGDAVVLTCYDGFVRMLDIATGSSASSYNSNGKIYATPLLASTTLYFGDMTGAFTALEIVSPNTR
jgi:outer membrane protein assembly factor BamB